MWEGASIEEKIARLAHRAPPRVHRLPGAPLVTATLHPHPQPTGVSVISAGAQNAMHRHRLLVSATLAALERVNLIRAAVMWIGVDGGSKPIALAVRDAARQS